jgi:hypothetical protein
VCCCCVAAIGSTPGEESDELPRRCIVDPVEGEHHLGMGSRRMFLSGRRRVGPEKSAQLSFSHYPTRARHLRGKPAQSRLASAACCAATCVSRLPLTTMPA